MEVVLFTSLSDIVVRALAFVWECRVIGAMGDIHHVTRRYLSALAFVLKHRRLARRSKVPCVVKIDIDAGYYFPLKDKSTITATLSAVAKELVFDIDLMDDEDIIRDLG